MKILFKNVTRYDSKSYNKFVKFHNEKYSDKYFFVTIVFCILLLYCSILNLKNKNIMLGLCFIAVILIFIFVRFYLPIKRYKNTSKKYENNQKTLYTFSFYRGDKFKGHCIHRIFLQIFILFVVGTEKFKV